MEVVIGKKQKQGSCCGGTGGSNREEKKEGSCCGGTRRYKTNFIGDLWMYVLTKHTHVDIIHQDHHNSNGRRMNMDKKKLHILYNN